MKFVDADLLARALRFEDCGTPDERWLPASEVRDLVEALPYIELEKIAYDIGGVRFVLQSNPCNTSIPE